MVPASWRAGNGKGALGVVVMVAAVMMGAVAVLHVDDVTVLGQSIDQGGRQLPVVQERPPFGEAQVGSDERCFLLVPVVCPTCAASTST
jgi:hypothetical protein